MKNALVNTKNKWYNYCNGIVDVKPKYQTPKKEESI